MKPSTYTDEHGDLHVESDGVHDPKIVYRWRVVSDSGPWKRPKGRVLPWSMTTDEAAAWQAKHRGTTIEKLEGSEEVRMPVDGWGSPHGRGGLGE
jgi:hypothetical protein